MEGNIIYEVNLSAEQAITEEFYSWLKIHITEMLEIDGFIGATLLEISNSDTNTKSWSVQYKLKNESALMAYLKNHAAHMRADGINRFGDAFTATRRVMLPIQEFSVKLL